MEKQPSTEVTVRKVSQLVAQTLRGQIARGEIREGDLLPPEPELVERFKVSRPTLREAIRILETEGLVTTTRGGRKGARVHYPSSAQAAGHAGLVLQLRGATITQVFELAAILVPHAARMAASRIRDKDVLALEAIFEAMREAEDRPRDLARLVRRFDIMICDLSGNEALKFVSQIMAEIIEFQIEAIPLSAAGLPQQNAADIAPSRERFAKVLEALRDRDGERAERLLVVRLREMLEHHRRVEDASPLRVIS